VLKVISLKSRGIATLTVANRMVLHERGLLSPLCYCFYFANNGKSPWPTALLKGLGPVWAKQIVALFTLAKFSRLLTRAIFLLVSAARFSLLLTRDIFLLVSRAIHTGQIFHAEHALSPSWSIHAGLKTCPTMQYWPGPASDQGHICQYQGPFTLARFSVIY